MWLSSSVPSGSNSSYLVEPVEELRLERQADRSHHRLAALLVVEQRVDEELGAEVARQDHDRVAEVDRAALSVGEAAVVEHLEQDVEHLRMGLLDLVEQDDGVRTPAHCLRELAALVVADVAGRRAQQSCHRMLLGVLAHVDPDDGPLVVEQEVGQRLGQLGLADARRAEEEERPGRAVRVGDTGPRSTYGV